MSISGVRIAISEYCEKFTKWTINYRSTGGTPMKSRGLVEGRNSQRAEFLICTHNGGKSTQLTDLRSGLNTFSVTILVLRTMFRRPEPQALIAVKFLNDLTYIGGLREDKVLQLRRVRNKSIKRCDASNGSVQEFKKVPGNSRSDLRAIAKG